MSQIEIWKEVKSYPNYEISNMGRLRNKKGLHFKLNPHKEKGYIEVSLQNEIGRVNMALHRIVAEHFVDNPNPEKYKCINHKKGIKTDNRASQLEWCSHSENMIHAYKTGLIKPTYGASKLTIEDAIDIKKLLKMGMDASKIGTLFGITSNQVRGLKKRPWKILKTIYKLSRLS